MGIRCNQRSTHFSKKKSEMRMLSSLNKHGRARQDGLIFMSCLYERRSRISRSFASFFRVGKNCGEKWSDRFRTSHQKCPVKKGVITNFAKFIEKRLQRLKSCNFIKNETLVQVFSCEFCEIFKNTYFVEHLRTTTSVN